MTSGDVIQLAMQHANVQSSMQSSAQLCLADAIKLQEQGQESDACDRAIKSLAYSVGIFHPDYQKTQA